jgi:hypothetical protein
MNECCVWLGGAAEQPLRLLCAKDRRGLSGGLGIATIMLFCGMVLILICMLFLATTSHACVCVYIYEWVFIFLNIWMVAIDIVL